ncbi:MAG: helix-turn-helix transcriptional regulator [Gallionella sp.]|nr:helix-turn-helix transcriptional regulator [Gallionella sp.]
MYNEKMNIGVRIRQLRERNTLSQEKFGELCGVSKASVSQWEIGIATPPTDRLIALRKHLAFSFDWLIAGEVDSNFALTRPSIQKLLAVAQPLPDSAVAALTREGDFYTELISPEKLLNGTK